MQQCGQGNLIICNFLTDTLRARLHLRLHLQYGSKSHKLAFIALGMLFLQGRRVHLLVELQGFQILHQVLNGVGGAAFFVYHHPAKATAFEQTRVQHIRDVGALHPVEPFVMNTVVNIYRYVVDVHGGGGS
jgi:hypothetical protein